MVLPWRSCCRCRTPLGPASLTTTHCPIPVVLCDQGSPDPCTQSYTRVAASISPYNTHLPSAAVSSCALSGLVYRYRVIVEHWHTGQSRTATLDAGLFTNWAIFVCIRTADPVRLRSLLAVVYIAGSREPVWCFRCSFLISSPEDTATGGALYPAWRSCAQLVSVCGAQQLCQWLYCAQVPRAGSGAVATLLGMADYFPHSTGNRWATITVDDRSGILYVVAFLGFTYTSLTFIARAFIKWRVLGLDDAAVVIAQIASLAQFALLLTSLSAGLGKNFVLLTEDQYARMVSSQLANQICLYISLGFSKIATVLLTQRIFTRDMRTEWNICSIIIGSIAIWSLLAPILASVGCSAKSIAPKTASQTCPSIAVRYTAIVATDAITDVILVIIPASLCWQLQMSIMLKLQVLAVFACRLPLVILAALFLKAWTYSLSAENPGIERTTAIIYQQSELCVSLMAATIPCLTSFIRSFDTGSGVKASFGSSNEYGSRTSTNILNHTESYKLSSMSRSRDDTARRPRSRTRLHDEDVEILLGSRPYTSGRSEPSIPRSKSFRATSEQSHKSDTDRRSQGGKRELLIRREMQFEVKSEEVRRESDRSAPGMISM